MTAPIAEQIRLFAVFLAQFRQFEFEARLLPDSLAKYGPEYTHSSISQVESELFGAAGLAALLCLPQMTDLLFATSAHSRRLWLRLVGVDPNYTGHAPELADLRRLLDAALEADPDPMWYQPPAIPADECNAAAREAVAA